MQDLNKINSYQLYTMWKNHSIALLMIVVLISISKMLPYYFSPLAALLVAALLFAQLYSSRLSNKMTCMVVTYTIFMCILSYSFFSIIINMLNIWGIITIPNELSFFVYPYLPSLLMCPICFIVSLIIYFGRKRLYICVDCRLQYGDRNERGKLGQLLTYESHFQFRNLVVLFGLLSIAVWAYYLFVYIDTDVNDRDWYVFVWFIVIAFLLDEFYFMTRYYNLYLDFKENNEIISQEELSDMTSKTYLRFYLICGDYLYLTDNSNDLNFEQKFIDTPFVTKRSVNGITIPEVRNIIRDMSGIKDGDLRFFFGRKIPNIARHSLLRYFYFLPGKPEDYKDIRIKGEWIPFNRVKELYSRTPNKLGSIFITDFTRMATIILTQKLFNEQGYRKNKLKSYQPSFNLIEVKENNYDFQDDKWLRISLFNSDTKLYKFKKLMSRLSLIRRSANNPNTPDKWN